MIDYCPRYFDPLPDGTWLRFIHDKNGVYLETQKSIKNGMIDGDYIVYYPNGNIHLSLKTSMGYILEYLSKSIDSRIIEKAKLNCNVVLEKYDYEYNDSQALLSYYYNYYWGFISFQNGKISFMGNVYKGVRHGDLFEFDENGLINKKENFYYGEKKY